MAQRESDRRAQLLEKCFAVFCENGLENSGMKNWRRLAAAILYYAGDYIGMRRGKNGDKQTLKACQIHS